MMTLLYAVIVSAASMWTAATVERAMNPPALKCPAPPPENPRAMNRT